MMGSLVADASQVESERNPVSPLSVSHGRFGVKTGSALVEQKILASLLKADIRAYEYMS
jgi:hypothetical protein